MDDNQKAKQAAFNAKLSEVLSLINQTSHFDDAFPLVEHAILGLFQAQRITFYQKNLHSSDIVSRFKSGHDVREIRLPLSTTSIAGYVAFSRKPVNIRDVNDLTELANIHPNLQYDESFAAETNFSPRSMMVVPIEHAQVLLGVMQIINHQSDDGFSDDDLVKAQAFAYRIGQKLRVEFGCTDSPYEYLVAKQLIEPFHLQNLEKQAANGVPMTRLLRHSANIDIEDLGRSLECYYQVPFIRYDESRYQIHPLCENIKSSFLKSNNLALLTDGQSECVLVAIDDPNDTARVLAVEHLLGTREVRLCVALPDDIHQFLGLAEVGFDQAHRTTDEVELVVPGANPTSIEELDDSMEGGADVVKLVNNMVTEASQWGASDIHIEPGREREPTRVRLRIDGVCQEGMQIPAKLTKAVISRIKVMAHMDIAERRLPQDGKFSVRYKGQLLEFRVATLPTVFGESMVLRLLQTGEPIPFDKLNFSSRNHQAAKQLLAKPHGIILVVGPTGSGKTTTLHALLAELNTPDKKIWTAEDPVEITQAGMMQVQVQPKIGLDFASALRAFLRADPDIILIGETRDKETAKAAIDAALTGHLVLSTLHTNSAAETVTRLLSLGVEADNFAEALLGVLAQRLVRTLCVKCKTAYEPSDEEWQHLVNKYRGDGQSVKKPSVLYKAKGCSHCNNTGYRGRTGIHELLVTTDTMRQAIVAGADAGSLLKLAKANGMKTLLQDGISKIVKGQIDLEQLKRVAAE